MLSLSPGGMTAAHATKYFAQEDYYLRGAEPSQWLGKGSDALGLKGQVSEEDFRKLVEGKAQDGAQLVAAKITKDADGKQVETHRAGNDLTFSAPKSVSVGYAAGNRELKEIWDKAVVNTMKHVEEHYSHYRTPGGVKSSGNIMAAKFDHVTSRALDPEVHSHVFLLNMTRVPGAEGRWKANEPKNIYTDKISLGMLARQEAMHLYHQAGYQTYFTNRQQLLFEIVGVSPEELETFSKRSAAIAAKVAQWKEQGRFPGVSETILKGMAALDTRDPKRQVTREDVRRAWDRGFALAGTTVQKVRERIEAARSLPGLEQHHPAAVTEPDYGFRYQAPGEYPESLAAVLRHVKVPELKRQPGYQEAKRGGDLDAARQVVDALVRKEVVDEIKSTLPENAPVYVIAVESVGPQLNMLPKAYAERLARELGGEVWTGIAKVTGGHNTGASIDERLHNRQVFNGALPPGNSSIIIVDDTFTAGGTLTSLIDYLARDGNTPVCATTLATGRYGEKLAPTKELVEGLLEKAGVSESQFSQEMGYPPNALTGAEIRSYLRNGTRGLDGARMRFFASGGEDRSGRSEAIPPPAQRECWDKKPSEVIRLASGFLTNGEAVLDRAELLKVAAQISGGRHSLAQLNAAVDGWAGRKNGMVRMGRESHGWQAGKEFYSTGEMQELEARNQETLKNLGRFQSVTSRSEVEAYLAGLAREEGIVLSKGQHSHVVNELTGGKGLCVTQGDPGTGKTFTAEIIERFNREILQPSGRNHYTLNLAYTGKAALELSKASGKPAYTIDSFLNDFHNGSVQRNIQAQMEQQPAGSGMPTSRPVTVQVIIKVDEASFVGARQAEHLLHALAEIRAQGVAVKLVEIGDHKQMQSLQASPFFNHASGLARQGQGDYAELKEISRQQNQSLRQVAEILNREDGGGLGANAQQALGMLESQGRTREISDRRELIEAAVSHYQAESSAPSPDPARAAAGENKSVLLVTPQNLDREELNMAIRDARLASGGLGAGKRIEVLSPVRQEVTSSSYEPGMTLVFSGERGADGKMHPVPGTYLNQQGEIQSRDPERNTVTVRMGRRGSERAGDETRMTQPRNITKTFDAARLPGTTTLYRREQREFAPGERIVFGKTINDQSLCAPEGVAKKGRGVRNGEMGQIVDIRSSANHSVALLKLDDGREVNLHLDRFGPQSIDYGYAVTIYKGQGGTVDSVIPFHYVKPGMENDQRLLETLIGVKLDAPRFRQWSTTLSDYEKSYQAAVGIGGHRGELGFTMVREKDTGQEHKGVAIRFHNGLAVVADEGARQNMREAGMYWSQDTRSWVTAVTNERAMRLMDHHPLRNSEYIQRITGENMKMEPAKGGVERNFQAEIDTRAEAERYGRASYNSFNVAITRARHEAVVFTNSVVGLKQAVLSVDEKTSTVDNKLLSRIEKGIGVVRERTRTPPNALPQKDKQSEMKVPVKVRPGLELKR
jgi:conjugative relaxase-like TrwC/TraI family protein